MRLRIALCGDVMLGRGVDQIQRLERFGPQATLVNLENGLTRTDGFAPVAGHGCAGNPLGSLGRKLGV